MRLYQSFTFFLRTVLILLLPVYGCTPDADQADLILVNGRVWTAAGENAFAEAVAIRGERILKVGSSAEIQRLAGKATRTIDLNGKLVIPGFNDAHIHFLGGSMGLSEVDLTGVRSPQEVVSRVNGYAAKNPEKQWITGRGWQYTIFTDGLPSVNQLGGIISDRPVYLRAYDGHSAWANQRAMKLADIKPSTTLQKGFGKVVRDGRGTPTGALLEDAQSLVASIIPEMSREEKLAALRQGLKLAASFGITSLQNANGSPEELSLYETLLAANELTARYAASFSANASTTPEQIEEYTAIKDRIGSHNAMLSAHAIKFMLDGVIEAHTAAMIAPYDDVKDGARGDFALPLETYKALVKEFDKRGFRIYTHAIGDLAIREALNAYEDAGRTNGLADRRHRVEHIESVSPADIPRFGQLGVLASMQPIHANPESMGVWSKAVGAARHPNSFAWAALLNQNATLVFSSDWPACTDHNPITGLHIAVNRKTIGGFPPAGWEVQQQVSIGQALLAYTRAGAFSSFEEGKKGQIRDGYLADLLILSDDFFVTDPMKIFETKVLVTIFNGKVIFEKEKL